MFLLIAKKLSSDAPSGDMSDRYTLSICTVKVIL